MGDNTSTWPNSSFKAVMSRLLEKKDNLRRVILTSLPAAGLVVQVMDRQELNNMLRRAGKIWLLTVEYWMLNCTAVWVLIVVFDTPAALHNYSCVNEFEYRYIWCPLTSIHSNSSFTFIYITFITTLKLLLLIIFLTIFIVTYISILRTVVSILINLYVTYNERWLRPINIWSSEF